VNAGEGIERVGDALYIRGPITIANVEALLQQGSPLLQSGTIVDLSQVTDVDSSAVSLLLQWTRQAEGRGERLRIRNVHPNIRSLSVLYGVNDLLPIEQPTKASAS